MPLLVHMCASLLPHAGVAYVLQRIVGLWCTEIISVMLLRAQGTVLLRIRNTLLHEQVLRGETASGFCYSFKL